MRVWLIRHGPVVKPPHITIGAGDPPLSDEGRAHAERVALELRPRMLSAVWSSDRRRAMDTASIIASPHGLGVLPTPALRELDFGAWEGRDLRELWRDDPDAARAWEENITDTPASFGERVDQLLARVGNFWESVEVKGEVAVVAHRGSLAALQSSIDGRPFAESFRSPSAWAEAPASRRRMGRNASR